MTELDKLDIKILRELIQGQDLSQLFLSDFRRSLRVIGKKFRVDEHTVKNRMARLRQLGLWQGWWLVPPPNVLGLYSVMLSFDVPPQSKDDLIPKLRLMEDVLVIRNYFGTLLGVTLTGESEQSFEKQVELIARISNAENMVVSGVRVPKSDISLSKTDWEIISNIHRNPRKSYIAVAKELRLASKTVKRRLARMIEGRALFAFWTSNPKLFKGAILADLRVFHDSPESRAEVDQKIISQLDDYLYFAGLVFDNLGFFLLIVPSVTKMQEIVKWVKQQQGVRNARIDILQERIESYEQISKNIEKKLAQIQLTNV
ncbi:MAG: winged helix-turn-helix transcriptional regulator [Thaumarchaeota archaeon]|nr:winged helix-turn-helix transcriptional regulator [Nitrososphaerota archaeon]